MSANAAEYITTWVHGDIPGARRLTALLSLATVLLLTSAAEIAFAADDIGADIDRVLAGPQRSERNRARDIYRHPKETLLYFGIRPDMQVAEVWPGGGWYTEILAPLLRERGRYFAAHYHVDENTHRYYRNSRQQFMQKLDARPDIYDRVVLTGLLPPHVALAPKGSLDLVLTFRNVHNWTDQGYDQQMFHAFFDALKPGAILGVVEHRARDGTSRRKMIRSGYMTEAYVIELAQKAGFKLAGRSEVNANPKDTKDHPRGVWTLPPTLRLGDDDRAKYLAIGESDRMTVKFVKP